MQDHFQLDKVSTTFCLSNRFDDPDGTLAENVEFLPSGESKKPCFTDVSMRNVYSEVSSDR